MMEEFKTLAQLEAQAGRAGVVKLLTNHRLNVNETVSKLSALKTSIRLGAMDAADINMTAHRMKGACGSLGFRKISELFDRMDQAAEKGDANAVAQMIEAVEEENAALELAVKERYPEV